jgi:hypothetical protein
MYGQPHTPKAVSRQTGLRKLTDACMDPRGQLVHSNIMIFYIMHGVVQVISTDERIFASRGVGNVL